MMRISYKLKKRTTKTEELKNPKTLLKNVIISFQTIRSKVTASGNIIHSVLIHNLMGPVSFILLTKEWKIIKKQQIQKKNERDKCRSN